ncbi:MAG: hypothetical protein ACR2G6_13820 [Gemmatimonadaceae bacterium]
MNQTNNRRKSIPSVASGFDQARDELFQHIMRCGVVGADPEHQKEWFDDTISYIAERYSELDDAQVTELRTLGVRFCQPPKARGGIEAGVVSAA